MKELQKLKELIDNLEEYITEKYESGDYGREIRARRHKGVNNYIIFGIQEGYNANQIAKLVGKSVKEMDE